MLEMSYRLPSALLVICLSGALSGPVPFFHLSMDTHGRTISISQGSKGSITLPNGQHFFQAPNQFFGQISDAKVLSVARGENHTLIVSAGSGAPHT